MKEEIEEDKRRRTFMNPQEGYKVVNAIFGIKLSRNLIDDQIAIQKDETVVEELIEAEYEELNRNKLVGGTAGRSSQLDSSRGIDMAYLLAERAGKMTKYDTLVLAPALLRTFFDYSGRGLTAQIPATVQSDKSVTAFNLFDFNLAWAIEQNFWWLGLLSALSGLSPATRIVAKSHISRMPDCPNGRSG